MKRPKGRAVLIVIAAIVFVALAIYVNIRVEQWKAGLLADAIKERVK